MITIKVNGTEIDAVTASATDKRIDIETANTFAECLEWGNPTIEISGVEYSTAELLIMEKDGNIGNHFGWKRVTEVTTLTAQLETANTELADKNSKLTAVSDAITALGDGVPTLAKLKTFLTAVKEAVGYGND